MTAVTGVTGRDGRDSGGGEPEAFMVAAGPVLIGLPPQGHARIVQPDVALRAYVGKRPVFRRAPEWVYRSLSPLTEPRPAFPIPSIIYLRLCF